MNINLVANTIRTLSMDGVQAAKSGHPGMPMGMADVAAVLWLKYLKHNPKNPTWTDRDRFILSKGHAGAIVSGEDETAEAKKREMSECGIHVVDSPADIGSKMKELIG